MLSPVWLCNTMDCSPPGSLSMGFPRQEHWKVPFPSPGDLPGPRIKPTSPALAAAFFTVKPPGKPSTYLTTQQSTPRCLHRVPDGKCYLQLYSEETRGGNKCPSTGEGRHGGVYPHTLEWREKASGPCNRVGETWHPRYRVGVARHTRPLLQWLILCGIHLLETGSLVGCLGWENWLRKDRGDLAGDKCSIVIGMVIDTRLYTVLKTLEMSVFLKGLLMLTIFKVFIEFVTVLLLFLMFSFFWPGVTGGFSSIRSQTRNSCIERQILNPWTDTGEKRAGHKEWQKEWHSPRTQYKLIWVKWDQDGSQLWLYLGPLHVHSNTSVSYMTHPEVPWQFQGQKDHQRPKTRGWPSSWTSSPFPRWLE